MVSIIKRSGFSLVEIIVGAAIIASSVVAIVGVYGTVSNTANRTTPRLQASFLAEEGVEAVRSMRDKTWSGRIANLTVGTTYYLSWTGTEWIATTTSSQIDSQFTRTVSFQSVNRDGNYNIASTGSNDTSTRKATINVSWRDNNATSTRKLESYIFNTFNN